MSACVPDPVASETLDPGSSGTSSSSETGDEPAPTTSGTDESGADETTETSGTTGTTGAAVVCGDGDVGEGELCDDGDVDDGDGCSADCSAATCLVPVTHPTVQAGVDDPACPVVWLAEGKYAEVVVIERDVELVAQTWATLSGEDEERPLEIAARASVVQRGLTVKDGCAERGAGILSHGTLELVGTTVTENRAEGVAPCGGGIWSDGVVVLRGSVVTSNTSWPMGDQPVIRGGGICMEGGRLELREASRVSGNEARAKGKGPFVVEGGGIAANGTVIEVVEASLLSGNYARVVDATAGSTAAGGAIHLTGGSVTMVDALLDNNRAQLEDGDAAGEALRAEGGGVVLVGAVLDATGTRFEWNQALTTGVGRPHGRGGAVAARGGSTVALHASDFVVNQARGNGSDAGNELAVGQGGSVYLAAGTGETTSLVVEDSAVFGGSASATAATGTAGRAAGGGLFATASGEGATTTLTVVRSAVLENKSSAWIYGDLMPGDVTEGRGGGIALAGEAGGSVELALVDSTLYANTAIAHSFEMKSGVGVGGGFAATAAPGSDVAARMRSATITRNEARDGAGVWIDPDGAPVLVELANSAILDNHYDECAPAGAMLTSLGHNAFGPLECGLGEANPSDLLLEEVSFACGDHGGPTLSCKVDFDHPLREAGDPDGCRDVDGVLLETDQRGMPRHVDAACDIGAYEFQ